MVQERFQSIISQLFQYVRLVRLSFVFKIIKVSSFDELVSFFPQRIIRCGGAVDDDMANIIVAQLLYLDAVDPTKVVKLKFISCSFFFTSDCVYLRWTGYCHVCELSWWISYSW